MQFGFNEEQQALQREASKALADLAGPARARKMFDASSAHDPRLWKKAAELGWTALLVPEEQGGVGGSLVELVVLAEAMGRWLWPGPFVTCSAGLEALRRARPEQTGKLLGRVASGEQIVGVALGRGVRAARGVGGKLVLDGEMGTVLDADAVDVLVVEAELSDVDRRLVLVPAGVATVSITQRRALDPTRRPCRVTFRSHFADEEDILVPLDEEDDLVSRAANAGAMILAADLVGVMAHMLETSVAYANERKQFGRPIGSFQAIQYKLVDMLVELERSRALAYFAAWALENADPATRERAAAMAKSAASDAATHLTSEAIQVHGGIGFTWEHDAHLYHRRALSAAAWFGTAAEHRERIAKQLEV